MEQFYVPQMGDEIVYLIGIHQQWFEENPHNGTVMPCWSDIGNVRFAEPCKVTKIEYTILAHEEGKPTVPRIVLTFTDSSMPYYNSTITVDAPPPNFGHEEFIVEQHRWFNSIEKRWHVGDLCKVNALPLPSHKSTPVACQCLSLCPALLNRLTVTLGCLHGMAE